MPGRSLPPHKGPGAPLGTKYVKSAFKRAARQKPDLLPKAAMKTLEDAAGITKVSRYVVVDKDLQRIEEEIHPRDRRAALQLARDTLDGTPTQEIQMEGAPPVLVYVATPNPGEAPEFPPEIQRYITGESALDDREPVDFEDPELDLDDE